MWRNLEIRERVGRGQFGDVYRAWDPAIDRDVALKLLRREDATRGADLVVVEEARLMARVRHPNVVTIYGAAHHDGFTGLWMEFIQGRTLEGELREQGPFESSEVTSVGIELCRALSAVHTAGLVHRDVKAPNVMREVTGRVVLGDFGTGLDLDDEAAGPTLAGTPVYLAPEVFKREPATPLSDVYSLGVLLFHLTTGSYPVKGRSLAELRDRHALGTRERLRDVRPNLPPAFADVVDRALAPIPDDRFSSAAELERALVTSVAPAVEDVVPAQGTWVSLLRSRRTRLTAGALLVAALAVISGLSARSRLAKLVAPEHVQSLAVLPLDNLSGDPEQEYLAAGMTDALITELGQIAALRVISRTSSGQYKGRRKPLPEIAKELNVDAIVEGSVLRSGERLGITVQLVQAREDRHLWSKSYDRDLRDVLTLHREVAQTIAEQVQVTLTQSDRARLTAAASIDPVALDAYLQGRYLWNQGNLSARQKSIPYLEEAIRRSPKFATAWAGLSDAYFDLASEAPPATEARASLIAKTKTSAQTAVEIDPASSDARVALAWALWTFDWDWRGAEQEFKSALTLAPNNAMAHQGYAMLQRAMGNVDQSLFHARRSRELDPISTLASSAFVEALLSAGHTDEALNQAQTTLELHPGRWIAHEKLGHAYLARGTYDEAIRELEISAQLSGGRDMNKGLLGSALGRAGRRTEAETIAADLENQDTRHRSTALALVYTALGDHDRAFMWLERGVRDKTIFLYVNSMSGLAPLRPDPRFDDLLKRMGLP